MRRTAWSRLCRNDPIHYRVTHKVLSADHSLTDMATVSVGENQLFTDEAVEALQEVVVLYLLSVHYPRIYSALMWGVTALELAEQAGSLAKRGGQGLLRAVVNYVVLEVTGISDVIDAFL